MLSAKMPCDCSPWVTTVPLLTTVTSPPIEPVAPEPPIFIARLVDSPPDTARAPAAPPAPPPPPTLWAKMPMASSPSVTTRSVEVTWTSPPLPPPPPEPPNASEMFLDLAPPRAAETAMPPVPPPPPTLWANTAVAPSPVVPTLPLLITSTRRPMPAEPPEPPTDTPMAMLSVEDRPPVSAPANPPSPPPPPTLWANTP